MKQLYFIRHGESELNKAHKWAGSSDTALTPRGHQQAKHTGRAAKDQHLTFDIIITSPLQRAHHTAQHVATAVDYPKEAIVLHPLFVERNFGELEGKVDLGAKAKNLLDETEIDSRKDVEPLLDLQHRAEEALAYLSDLPYDNILVVSHGAFGRALRRAINKEPLHRRGASFDNAQLVRLV